MVAEEPNEKSERLHRRTRSSLSPYSRTSVRGENVRHRTIQNLRRILLGLSQHYLYYSADAETEIVEVLALWHTSRGSDPKF